MAASTSPIVFKDFPMEVGGTSLGGLESCQITYEQDLARVYPATPITWESHMESLRGGTGSFNFHVIDTTHQHGAGATLSVDNGTTDLKGLRDVTIALTMNPIEVSSQVATYVKTYVAGVRSCTVNFDSIYYDPADAAALTLQHMTGNVISGTDFSAAVLIDFGSGDSISFTGSQANLTIDRAADDAVKVTGTVQASGAVTEGVGGWTTQQLAMFDAFFNNTSLTIRLTNAADSGATAVSGATYYEQTAFVTGMNIEIPYAGPVTVSGSFITSGAITKSTEA